MALVKEINATLLRMPVSASRPTGSIKSNIQKRIPRMISQGVKVKPRFAGRIMIMRGPRAMPNVPPAPNSPTASSGFFLQPRAMLAIAGYKAAEPSPPTRISANSV